MKFLTVILALFILTLSLLPCEDQAKVADVEVEQVICNDCDGDTAGDLCTPFCHCQCCSIHFISFDIESFEMLSLEVPRGKFIFMDTQEQEVLFSFHQPPQV